MNGAELIVTERERQISEEGWTPEHDDTHNLGELAKAGAAYALCSYGSVHAYEFWPFSTNWNPGNCSSIDGRIRLLAKAGALLAAEIDRLQRVLEPSDA